MAMYNCELRSCREVMSCFFAEHVAAFLVESLELRVIAWLLGVLPNSWEVEHDSPVSHVTICHPNHRLPPQPYGPLGKHLSDDPSIFKYGIHGFGMFRGCTLHGCTMMYCNCM